MPLPLPNGMDAKALNGTDISHKSAMTQILTNLKKWSCEDRPLPDKSSVKAVHIYDFDNTLFATPLPNKQLWVGKTIGHLSNSDVFINGGWWHDSRILAATGEGIEIEEPKAWKGWWNEEIVSLVRLSMEQQDVLTVLLTGRAENKFSELVKRIVKSRNLVFDMCCLRKSVGPNNQLFASTLAFKQAVLNDIVHGYSNAEAIRVYEDRPQHVKAFRSYLISLNKSLLESETASKRRSISSEVIQVAENSTSLNPKTEIAEIQKMVNDHNTKIREGSASPGRKPLRIKRKVFFTGYLIASDVSRSLQKLIRPRANIPAEEIRILANSIMITQGPVTKAILANVGGLGKTVKWRVKGIAELESRLWAVHVEPISDSVITDSNLPTVVLATRRGARPSEVTQIREWKPVANEDALEFEAVVGERALLQIDEERSYDSEREDSIPRRATRRPLYRDYDYNTQSEYSTHSGQSYRGAGNRHRNFSPDRRHSNYDDVRNGGGRGGSSYRGRGMARDRGGRGTIKTSRYRGRGGPPNSYRSLDDMRDRYNNTYTNNSPHTKDSRDVELPYNAY